MSFRNWPSHWPLTALFLGFPLWWILGIAAFAPMLAAGVMLVQLKRQRGQLLLPPGFSLWLLFLCWVALGVFVLTADAPGAVPGGGWSRLVVFGYRLGWYLTCTIVLVWLGNQTRQKVSFAWVTQLLGFMFVVTIAGGLLGVLTPGLELKSALELVLPGPLRTNSFVSSLVHPGVADIQDVLGRPQARPKAPFAFANSWGSNFALFLPFFVLSWWTHGRWWQRTLTPVALIVGAIPVIYSLNRGLWVSLALMVAAAALLQLRGGRPRTITVTVVVLVVAIVGLVLSPLGSMVQERMDNPHSNARRGSLLTETVRSAATGSPVVGFGTTRDVQGSFASIAGGATPTCPACEVPPLGTQGHLWLVIFSQGLVGAVLFLVFLIRSAALAWPLRTRAQLLCGFVLGSFALQLPIYDTLGMPLLTVMVAIALAWRETGTGQRLEGLSHRLRRSTPLLTILVLVGAVAGGTVVARQPTDFEARVSVLLPSTAISSPIDDLETRKMATLSTVDTEAAMVVSTPTLQRTAKALSGRSTKPDLVNRVSVTAATNTRLLQISVRAGDEATAGDEVQALSRAYLSVRGDDLSDRREKVLDMLAEQRAALNSTIRRQTISTSSEASAGIAVSSDLSDPLTDARRRIELATTSVLLNSTSPGEIVRSEPPTRVQKEIGVGIASGAALGLALASCLVGWFVRFRGNGWNLRRRRT